MAEKGFFTRIGERADQFRENLSLRFNRAKDGLVNRFNGIRTEVTTKIAEIGTRVAIWGFEHLVEPHQQRITEILTIPALIGEHRALGAIRQTSGYESLARLAGKRASLNETDSEWLRTEAVWLRKKSRETRKRAAGLIRKAAEQRGRVGDAFTKARGAVALYQATTAA